jgi:hypothetical protein
LQLLQATGGSSNFQWSTINNTSLPPGLGFNSAQGVTSISGTPTTAGTFSFILQVQDTQNPQLTPATQQFSITINPGSGIVTVKDVQLLVSSPQLLSASNNQSSCSSSNSVTLTALVRDNNNNVLSGIPVAFNADNDGTILVTSGTTDKSGTAQAQLCTPVNSDNRTINVTASAGGKSANVTVQVTGTTIRIAGPTSAVSGSLVTLALTLTDSSGAGIANKTLNIASALNNPISNPAPLTDSNGGVKVTITAANTGSDTITVTGAGANAVQLLSISPDSFAFITPAPPPASVQEISLNTDFQVNVKWLKAGVPQQNQTVNFSTTRGTITATGQTDNSGQVTATLKADSAGPAVITASVNNGPSTQVEVLFVATVAATLTLQADPATLAPNQQSMIKATVFDPNKNRVKDKNITFTLSDTTGGSISAGTAVTNAYGEASISYTAGAVASAKDGVKVTAAVAGTALQETASLTVTQQLFIVLGTGNLIQKPDSTRYEQPYSVVVTDAVGGPVPNVNVTLNIVPTDYGKGFYTYSSSANAWVQTVTATCPNEDFFFGVNDPRSGNGILDPGEDQNGNGRLDPGNVVTLSPAQVTTDKEGFGYFNLFYAQQFASWITVELTAQATVAGSEAINVANYVLPGLASDYTNKNANPPGNPSPFGVASSCAIVGATLSAQPTTVSGTGTTQVVLTLLQQPQGTPLTGVLVTGAVISTTSSSTTNPLQVTVTSGKTDQQGQVTSTVTVAGGTTGDQAVIGYIGLGATVTVNVFR